MSVTFAKPKSAPKPTAPKRVAGGDNEVERDAHQRPRILVDCDRCGGTGTLPSTKREGKTVKCLPCKGEGRKKVSYTRVTTFIDVLDDKRNIDAWHNRLVLLGIHADPALLDGVGRQDPESKAGKDWLNRRAEIAMDKAGRNVKSERGTHLHELSELIDLGLDLPGNIDPDDFLGTMAYAEATQHLLNIVHMEQLVVNDEYRVAGTPDRVSSPRRGVTLRAPDGEEFGMYDLLITDLKTGRVDLGGLKMAMQLSIYANSKLYDKDGGKRISMGRVSTNWGIIMHAAAGECRTDLYWADLRMGWSAVEVAYRVRQARSAGRKALVAFNEESTVLLA